MAFTPSQAELRMTSEICATRAQIDAATYGSIETCLQGMEGDNIISINAEKATKLQNEINIDLNEKLPWLLFNQKYSQELQEKGQKDLISLLCELWANSPSKISPRVCSLKQKIQ